MNCISSHLQTPSDFISHFSLLDCVLEHFFRFDFVLERVPSARDKEFGKSQVVEIKNQFYRDLDGRH